jgi:hypothetical protein
MIVGSAHVGDLLVEFAKNRRERPFFYSFLEGVMQRLGDIAGNLQAPATGPSPTEATQRASTSIRLPNTSTL